MMGRIGVFLSLWGCAISSTIYIRFAARRLSCDHKAMNDTMPMNRRILLWVASIGPLGHLPASGTATVAIVGLPLMYWMLNWPIILRVIVTLVVTGVSIWIHDVGDRLLGEKDSRKLVWDEIVGFMFAVALLPEFSWALAGWAFFIERFIDIIKVPPARGIEKKWPGGWGVVGDDVVAGIYTYVILMLMIQCVPNWVGLGGT